MRRVARPARRTYEAKLSALAGTINEIGPDVLGVQEVGSPAALEDLRDRLDGDWAAPVFGEPGERPIRVAFLSRHPLMDVTNVLAFPARTDPVKTEDDGTEKWQMSRGALHVRVRVGATDVELIVCHLKSKLLHFPSPPNHPSGGFSTRDEGVRARYAGYALALRAAEAITVRAHVTERLDGHGQQRALIVLGDLKRRAARGHDTDPARPPRLGDRHRRL